MAPLSTSIANANSSINVNANNLNTDDNDSGTLQTLAQGSQDLTAFIALLATDSVEKVAFDYTQGLLPAAVAPLSIFGILGYVKALLKLSVGAEACDRIGVHAESLRSHFGLSTSELASTPKDSLIEVYYMGRERYLGGDKISGDGSDGQETRAHFWTIRQISYHNSSTLPEIKLGGQDTFFLESHVIGSIRCQVTFWKLCRSVTLSLLLLGISALLSSAAITPFVKHWTFSMWFAVVGTPAALVVGSVPWLLIYVNQTVPVRPSPWHGRRMQAVRNGDDEKDKDGLDTYVKPSMRPQHFAYIKRGEACFNLDCRVTVYRYVLLACVIIYCCVFAAASAYLCEYVELRNVSSEATAIWLGLQALLACLRILFWLKVPGFSCVAEWLYTKDLTSYMVGWPRSHPNYDLVDFNDHDSFTELEYVLHQHSPLENERQTKWKDPDTSSLRDHFKQWFVPCADSRRLGIETRPMPDWAADALDIFSVSANFLYPFHYSAREHSRLVLELLCNTNVWIPPQHVLLDWLAVRCKKYFFLDAFFIVDKEGVSFVVPW